MTATGRWRLRLAVLLVGLVVVACGGDSEPQQKTLLPKKIQPQAKVLPGEAKPYIVVRKDDNSFPGRKRVIFTISSSADSIQARSGTVVKAALDLQKTTSADLVEVCLYPSEKLAAIGDSFVAKALFAPDGGGASGNQGWRWDVCVSSEPYTKQDIEIEESWLGNKDRFRMPNGGVDEQKLKKFLSKKLGLPVGEIVLPFLSCDTTVNVN